MLFDNFGDCCRLEVSFELMDFFYEFWGFVFDMESMMLIEISVIGLLTTFFA